ncbi:Glutamate or tyrosine decarboxylase [Arboricoccus pini]|uniref:Glutamate or tyrosine decarboxylase n=1 Tax=Arboricoccus pini TaxID=1963835 RepID=A0A212PX12_9PROT|nr:aminotransferase class V-fold PLP-dependent enzyme [Arboricoccus pini]SNB51573.1 Glutamate or tyrosine decarboxylase [Arboricoccus pini]
MDDNLSYDLFARAARLVADYREGVAAGPQCPAHDYKAALASFAGPTPETGEPARDVIDDLAKRATPGLHAVTGDRFFGWVMGASHPVGVAADMLTSGWGQNAGNHLAAPATAAAETVSAGWLLDILGLPAEASVGFVTGASVANSVALAAARQELLRRLGYDLAKKGQFGAPPIRVLLGEEAHATVLSALRYLGFGEAQLQRVATDAQGSMLPQAAEAAIRAAHDWPALIVVTQAGQINTGAFDPHPAIIAIARRHPNAWVHVDGAFGLWARATPRYRHLAQAVDEADSWATDGHKWLQLPFDSGFAIVRDAVAHGRALTTAASYLPTSEAGDRDPSHYVPELSRRARGFATFAMLRHLGRAGIARMVERHCSLAHAMAARLAAEPGITILNEVVLNQVAVRFGDAEPGITGDEATRRTIARVQAQGRCFAGGALWRDRWIMRLSLISFPISTQSIAVAADAIIAAWREVQG